MPWRPQPVGNHKGRVHNEHLPPLRPQGSYPPPVLPHQSAVLDTDDGAAIDLAPTAAGPAADAATAAAAAAAAAADAATPASISAGVTTSSRRTGAPPRRTLS